MLSIVVPLPDGWSDFDINLARFALEHDFRTVEVVAVAPRTTGDAVARALRQYASFYDVCVTLVLSDAPLGYHEALEAGARAARADKLLFLSAAVFPRARGWLSRLLMEMRRLPDAGAISPDAALRRRLGPLRGKYRHARLQGGGAHRALPRLWPALAEGEHAAPVWSGTAECCVVRKKLFVEIGGFSQQFMDADLKTLDFGLRPKPRAASSIGSECHHVRARLLYGPKYRVLVAGEATG